MRVATIDIGTNSVLLLVAEQTPRGLMAIEERATVTRLGQGVDQTRTLSPSALARTNACLTDYAERIRLHGADRIAVVGTSALRDASGGEGLASFVQARLGTVLRVITGLEEARLTFLGAVSGLDGLPPGGQQCAFDVGGGSTEVVQAHWESEGRFVLDFQESFDVGSVRLTERFIKTDPPRADELDAIERALDETFAVLPPLASDPPPIGIAGTVTTLAAVSLQLETYDGQRVHGVTLELAEIQRIVSLLAAARLDDRRRFAGLHPGRADVIVAGGLVVLAMLRRLGAKAMRVSDRGLRWGLAQELVSRSQE
jgi:exopolyphosphatase/guanosine-5'-triphosphate,3'-diphosphate pyrophosphatase